MGEVLKKVFEYALLKILIGVVVGILIGFFLSSVSKADPIPRVSIEFSWDANTEPDLKGYRLYYGKQSRHDPALDHVAIYEAVKDKYCSQYDPRTDCEKEIDDFCTDVADKLCDYDFFTYTNKIELGKVTTYNLEGLADGTWYFAISAFDEDGNEGRYADPELTVKIDSTAPGKPSAFELKVSIKSILIESLKGKIE